MRQVEDLFSPQDTVSALRELVDDNRRLSDGHIVNLEDLDKDPTSRWSRVSEITLEEEEEEEQHTPRSNFRETPNELQYPNELRQYVELEILARTQSWVDKNALLLAKATRLH